MGIFDKMKGRKKNEPAKKPGQKADEKAKKAAASATGQKADQPKEKRTVTKGPLARDGAGDAHRILLRPVFTEKSSRLQAQNQHVFVVAPRAGKVEISQAIRDLYGVKPVAVRIVVVPGKAVHFGKHSGKEKSVKKAIVTFKAGEALTVLEG